MGLTRETETDIYGPSLLAQWSRIPLPRKETQVSSLGPEDPLEEEMATHSGIPAWEIPWTEEPGGLQTMGSQGVGHNRATETFPFTYEQFTKGNAVRAACECSFLHSLTRSLTHSYSEC